MGPDQCSRPRRPPCRLSPVACRTLPVAASRVLDTTGMSYVYCPLHYHATAQTVHDTALGRRSILQSPTPTHTSIHTMPQTIPQLCRQVCRICRLYRLCRLHRLHRLYRLQLSLHRTVPNLVCPSFQTVLFDRIPVQVLDASTVVRQLLE